VTSGEQARAGTVPWSGEWVAGALGVGIESEPQQSGSPLTVPDLVGMALRHNPRRAHLLVSTVLGKHLPADPRLVYGAGRLLGALVADRLTGRPSDIGAAGGSLLRSALVAAESAEDSRRLIEACDRHRAASRPDPGTLVLGYAETATALGHCVAESLAADYLHSTRRRVAGYQPVAGFEEEHSHATRHLLLPADPGLLAAPGPLVLVDDELSTGQTVLNTIQALHRSWPRQRYLIAALVDLRSAADRARLRQAAQQLGAEIDVVALASGQVRVPADAVAVGQELAAQQSVARQSMAQQAAQQSVAQRRRPARVSPLLTGPAGLAGSGRHGFAAGSQAGFEQASGQLARVLADRVRDRHRRAADGSPDHPSPDEPRRILVLGCEELMYAPLRIAADLAGELGALATVRFSSTTRSPVVAVDDPGYAIRNRLSFPSMDESVDGPGPRFVYNVAGSTPAEWFSDIVLVTDADLSEQYGPAGLVAQLASVTENLQIVQLPAAHRSIGAPAGRQLPDPLTGPAFGSYPAADVAWLLTDLSGVALEAPTEEREEAIQSGGAHYAESLPQEYQPSAEYQQLFADALAESAHRLAHAVGVVTELVLDRRGPGVVLASLARAGTPVGVLMRRWARHAHGVELPHYSVSIVRGRGIDQLALAYLARQHDPADVMFVDGWTGKGAIARELADAVAGVNQAWWPAGGGFSAELAVLADPGGCVSIYGTREDYLIPSACLNSTVSGLVSRTVLNAELIGPGQYHGAKFYAELADADVSLDFVDAITRQFPAVAAAVARDWPVLRDSDRRPTWAGRQSVRRLSEQYGIQDENLVKPGVGETTRVLLRRVPWKILIGTGDAGRLHHILLLARQRGVPVETVAGLAFSCVGLIHPGFSRASTGIVRPDLPVSGPMSGTSGRTMPGRAGA
jgi:phosphoribosyl transferase-like protein/RNA binding Pelota-like protein/phosphoribosyltransferase-like predicted ribonucleoside biosynthesis protein